MPKPHHYSPAIERFLVIVLYHEARHRKMPMTRLANEILKTGLADSPGWQLAMRSLQVQMTTPVPRKQAARLGDSGKASDGSARF